MSTNKYGAVKDERDGRVFASRKEARRYDELKLLEAGGVITSLECQVRFELQPSFKRDGKTERAIVYVADFVYSEDGKTVAEDVKGVRNPVFNLKMKMLLYKYPGLDFRLV